LLARADYVPQVQRYIRAVRVLLGVEPEAWLCFLDCRGSVRLVPVAGVS
jgi:hypothetical protein